MVYSESSGRNFIFPICLVAFATLSRADGTLPFKQASDILWLTGVDQEETVLVLFPDAHNPNDREILFTLETNEELAILDGAKLDKKKATAATGIANIQWTTAFERIFHRLMAEADDLYLNDSPHARARTIVETRTDRENAALRAKYPINRTLGKLYRTTPC